MTTKEAIQAMLDGKKVRPADENVAYFEHFHFDGVGFIDHNKDYFDFNYWMSEHTDWELYEEPKPKQIVVIEKWLLNMQGTKQYAIEEGSKEEMCTWGKNKIDAWQKVKLLDTYEVEL